MVPPVGRALGQCFRALGIFGGGGRGGGGLLRLGGKTVKAEKRVSKASSNGFSFNNERT